MTARTTITTGANSGIGLATTLELARRGFRSIGTVRSHAKAETLEKAAADAGVQIETAILDVRDADACARLTDTYRPYALVNNAGYSITGALEDVPDDEARAAMETMVLAPARLARLAIPHMRAHGGGRIVNVSSIFGRTTAPLIGWYQACKHGLEAISDALRIEVARDNIAVVLVEPGGFRTNIWDETRGEIERRGDSRYRPAYDRSLKTMKMGERFMGDPNRVAGVIARAVAGRSPRARSLVGIDAHAAALVERLTPTPVKDRITRLTLGL